MRRQFHFRWGIMSSLLIIISMSLPHTPENMASEARFKVNNKAFLGCLEHIRFLLSDENLILMRQEYKIIDILFKLEDFAIQSPTLLWLAKRGELLVDNGPSKRTIQFKMGNQMFEFGQIEFSLVTGLCFGLYPTIDDDPDSPFQDLFSSRSSLTFGRLSARLDEYAMMDPDSAFTRKLAVLYLIYSLVFVKDMNNIISFKCVRLADDPAMFNAFPWGRLIYEELVKEWAHAFNRIAASTVGIVQLKFATMPFAVQAWALESLGAEYSSILAEPNDNSPFPRLLRWRTLVNPDYALARQTIYNPEYIPLIRMQPEPSELEQQYYQSAVSWIGVREGVGNIRAPHVDDNPPAPAPGLLVIPLLRSMDKKIEKGMTSIQQQLSKLEKRVEVLEKRVHDPRQVEVRVMERIRNLASYQFEVARHRLNKQIRADMGLPPPQDKSPDHVQICDEEFQHNNEVVSPHVRTPVHESPLSPYDVAPSDGLAEGEPSVLQDLGCELSSMTYLSQGKAVGDEVDHPIAKKTVASRISLRLKRPGPAAQTPYTNPLKKTRTNVEVDIGVEVPLPNPYLPSTDYAYNTSKDEVLSTWLEKNKKKKGKKIGIVSIIKQMEVIPASNLINLRTSGWLSNEDTDAILQLFNRQSEEYPAMYPSTRWTCLGSLYSKAVSCAESKFVECRTIGKPTTGLQIPWEHMDATLYNTVLGINNNWAAKAWEACDYVFGIENVANCHWAAYSYDLKNKVVNVYDSMKDFFTEDRAKIFQKHAVIAPSLYNVSFAIPELDPDQPFQVKMVDVPQQTNGFDCGVYACKFIQCLTMQEDVHKLHAERFGDYRRKLAVDLIKWYRTPADNYAFKAVSCNLDKS